MLSIDLRSKSSFEILKVFESLHLKPKEIVEAEILESDLDSFGFKSFVDLAQVFFLKMLMPLQKDKDTIVLRFSKLDEKSSFHKSKNSNEKYGVESEFFEIDKTKQFSFLYHYKKALEFVGIESKQRVLNLGINRGDEFRVIEKMLNKEAFSDKNFVGVDYCASAIEYAKKEFNAPNIEFICHDINALDELDLTKSDLLISIGTLQSSSINFNASFMHLYQNFVQDRGAIILGFPNSRWFDGEMIYGAKAPNYSFSEMSLVLKDIHFCKKYLQQKKYRVVITGKDYLFLSARKI
ncbi:MAG: class I SAM-dependent methyltransferase [Sulfurimonas sp.]|uniref:class I SAM-dependent methyltransferase n=1 Tax=Sulfurimonas sp. TaxID=2022749 RepID=UPI0025DAB679|nr:class I SAM-dependent methyltransferase [Sulfurimonas sp.]MCK9492260.1 class I SAM-dependent methyltransferase [Sulfurimonas sp.]